MLNRDKSWITINEYWDGDLEIPSYEFEKYFYSYKKTIVYELQKKAQSQTSYSLSQATT